ncbi:hypothetical protein HPB49_023305 [Dermacentor silvarum]|uniref:Uncharacterized protein n=1 Tax=Dermacentor silvarum TaxID=543639 RepID=A0ACB8D8P8_DERSI|nr:hypothetical protein HPB49_023305 [Dermacentor silvarum]
MEEAGIALAMRNLRATFVLTDSQAAYRNFARGQVGHLAHSIRQQAAANRQEGQWKHQGTREFEARLLMPPPENFYTGTPPIAPQHNFSLTRTIPSPSFHILRSCNSSGCNNLGKHRIPEARIEAVMREMCDLGRYHLTNNNCQKWVQQLLRRLGIQTPSGERDAQAVVEEVVQPALYTGYAVALLYGAWAVAKFILTGGRF